MTEKTDMKNDNLQTTISEEEKVARVKVLIDAKNKISEENSRPEEPSELTIAYMYGFHKRDDEIRQLQSRIKELEEKVSKSTDLEETNN